MAVTARAIAGHLERDQQVASTAHNEDLAMKWSDQYATGVERIDVQHRMIFKMAEDFRAALDEGRGAGVYGVLLESLNLYVRTHFNFEEGCMNRAGCPAARKNSDAHAKFVEVLTRFRQRYELHGFDPGAAHDLVDTIDSWLSDHICRIDVQLKSFSRDV